MLTPLILKCFDPEAKKLLAFGSKQVSHIDDQSAAVKMSNQKLTE